ncbi:hypothetical protein F4604DRAFT_1731709, partial [Suillus subluteus]
MIALLIPHFALSASMSFVPDNFESRSVIQGRIFETVAPFSSSHLICRSRFLFGSGFLRGNVRAGTYNSSSIDLSKAIEKLEKEGEPFITRTSEGKGRSAVYDVLERNQTRWREWGQVNR